MTALQAELQKAQDVLPEDNDETEVMDVDMKDLDKEDSGFTVITNFDPDSDGFKFEIEAASTLHRNMNILQFIRKKLLPSKGKHFDQQAKNLAEYLAAEFQPPKPAEDEKIVIDLDGESNATP